MARESSSGELTPNWTIVGGFPLGDSVRSINLSLPLRILGNNSKRFGKQ